MLTGIPASPGVGIGKVVFFRQETIAVERRVVADIGLEKHRLRDALEVFVREVQAASNIVRVNAGAMEASILTTQITIMKDPDLRAEIYEIMEKDSLCAEYAFSEACDRYVNLFASFEDELMSARAADFRDIKRRFLRILQGIQDDDLRQLPQGSILVAEEIPPSKAALLDPARICGIVTRWGTKYSHISIIARALEIPAVVSVADITQMANEGDALALDGELGEVIVRPDTEALKQYCTRQQKLEQAHVERQRYRKKVTVTADKKRVHLEGNLSLFQEMDLILENNADGIGLFRTEFLYMSADSLPDEEQQFKAYKTIAQAMRGKPVIIRTLDVGGDKDIPYMNLQKERNPNMGCRAVRFSLDRTDIFKVQLAAILRASVYGDVKLMIPMISNLIELRTTKALLEEVKGELRAKKIPFNDYIQTGIMVETPAAAMCADLMAKECDFFSIGTNDLTQYTLAVDRGNELVAGLYSPRHPAVLRLIYRTVQGALQSNIPVAVCGESAADPLMVPLLIGAGVERLSVNPSRILRVRQQIAGINRARWERRFLKAIELGTSDEVSHFVQVEMMGI